MAYSLKHDDENLGVGVRRIARSQLSKALEEAADNMLTLDQKVHQLRKRCKKVRGLIRLVRPGFEAYTQENEALRDAARRLSEYRDAGVAISTLHRASSFFSEYLTSESLAPIRRELVHQRAAIPDHDIQQGINALTDDISLILERVDSWEIEGEGFHAARLGLGKTYKKLLQAMAAAQEDPEGEILHEWRKRVKYHGYHLRILKNMWEEGLGPHILAVREVADLLGSHHDIYTLRKLLDRSDPLSERSETFTTGLLRAREMDLEKQAFAKGARLFADRPDCLESRFALYWTLWRRE